MRVAIIGASHWHLPLYLEPLLEVPGAKVVGVSDPSQAVVAALSQKLDCVGDVDFRAHDASSGVVSGMPATLVGIPAVIACTISC